MKTKKGIFSWIGTGVFTIIGIVYILPILIVLMNSFKKKVYINKEPFQIPSGKTFASIENYISAIDKYELLSAVGWTVFITVGSVLVNLSMYINVRLVYYKGYDKIYEIILSSLCIFNGSSIPNGYVYTVSGCGPYRTAHAMGNYPYLFGIWSRACCVYVLWICKIYSIGNRRSCYD